MTYTHTQKTYRKCFQNEGRFIVKEHRATKCLLATLWSKSERTKDLSFLRLNRTVSVFGCFHILYKKYFCLFGGEKVSTEQRSFSKKLHCSPHNVLSALATCTF